MEPFAYIALEWKFMESLIAPKSMCPQQFHTNNVDVGAKNSSAKAKQANTVVVFFFTVAYFEDGKYGYVL